MAGGQAVGMTMEVRALTDHAELREAVRLQQEIWGFAEVELLPVRLFVVATKVGGQVFGAFDNGRMIAFLLAIPGIKPGGVSYLHSHMMGVLPQYRNQGLGRILKLRQFEDAVARGIRLIEWTFDPLEIKNAYFNIERLGAIVRRYVLNQYGTTSSHLHGGLPTDRCVAEWHITTKHVDKTMLGAKPPFETKARIDVPLEIAAWRTEDPNRAREAQKQISDQFLQHFRAGLAVLGFERNESAATYLLGKWQSD